VSRRARIVAPRRRPEIRPTSPKIDPCPIGTVIEGSAGLTSTATDPSAMANSEEPGSLRVEDHLALAKARGSNRA
jgi:hypothetical protein